MAAEKEESVWTPNPKLGLGEWDEILGSPEFSAQDYVDVMARKYSHLDPNHYHIKNILSPKFRVSLLFIVKENKSQRK